MSRNRTFALLGGLYVSQFIGVCFLYTALVGILRERAVAAPMFVDPSQVPVPVAAALVEPEEAQCAGT